MPERPLDEEHPATPWQRAAAWAVHLVTASGAVLGLFALVAIARGEFVEAFWWMAGTILIDSVDGTLARRVRAKAVLPGFDGALLDNIVDYFTYVLVPAFFLQTSSLLSEAARMPAGALILLASAYQFAQCEAKTADHFFKGFPSYWNLVVFYLFFWQLTPALNLAVLLSLVILVFVPIKYVYPTRMEYLTPHLWLRRAMLAASLIYGAATLGLLWVYPQTDRLLVGLSLGYVVLYVLVSIYRTLFPLQRDKGGAR